MTTKVGPRNEPYMTRGRSAAGSASGVGSSAAAPIAQGRRPDARSEALRADHPGYAERRHHGGRRLRRFGRAGPCARAERRRECAPARRRGARTRRHRDPCLVRRRARRAGPDAERAAVRGPGRLQGDGARHLGRGAGRRASSRAGRLRRREDAHERVGGHPAGDHPEGDRPRHDRSTPAPGPTCRSSTPRAPAPTRAIS